MSLTVAQLLPALHGGGVERGTLEVAAALVARGHRSLVISGGGRLVAPLVAQGSEHIALPVGAKSPLTLRLLPRLRRLLEQRQVDIVHARSRLPAWVAFLAWRRMEPATRPCFLTTVHGLYSVNRYSAIMMRGERIIAVSETVRDYITRNYPGVDAGRLRTIHRGVDETDFPYGYRPDARWLEDWHAAHPELAGKFVVTLPGRLSRLKGHRDFLDVIESVNRRGLPVHGLVVGADQRGISAFARTLRRRAARRGLPVTFAGQRDDMREIYAVSDLVVSLSSQPESFGRTVVEALRLGTPVVGYAHGGVGEILARMFPDGQVAPGNVGAAIDKVAELVRQPRTPPRSDAYPRRRMLEQTLALYAELTRCRSV